MEERRQRRGSGSRRCGSGRGRRRGVHINSRVVAEELLEVEAVEEPVPTEEGVDATDEVRPLPAHASTRELEAWRGEVRTAAIAAAGGLVAGAATVAAVRAVRAAGSRRRSFRRTSRRERGPLNVIASRSFLIDVHMLGK